MIVALPAKTAQANTASLLLRVGHCSVGPPPVKQHISIMISQHVQLHWLKVPWRIDYKMAVLVYKCLCMAWHRHTSLTNFIIQQSPSFEGACIPLRLTNCLFLVPNSQPTATELFQSPLYGSGTVFRSI